MCYCGSAMTRKRLLAELGGSPLMKKTKRIERKMTSALKAFGCVR